MQKSISALKIEGQNIQLDYTIAIMYVEILNKLFSFLDYEAIEPNFLASHLIY